MKKMIIFLAAGVVLAAGCSSMKSEPTISRTLYDFEAPAVSSNVVSDAVQVELTTGKGVTAGHQALKVVYPREALYKKVAFEPSVPWNVTDLGDCSIAIDIKNSSEDSVQLFLTLKDMSQSVTAHANIGAGESGTYYYDLAGPHTDLDLGMTGWPARPADEVGSGKKPAVPFRYAWGARVLDLSALNYIGLYQTGILTERTLIIDNIRIIANPDGDAAQLAPLVDSYGQYVGADWPGKVESDQQLIKQAAREPVGALMKDRSMYGGWKNGPRLEATGYFRAEKVKGKWALVDPDGYLFFATGIANCRMSNTYTVTGVHYENAEKREGEQVIYELRRNMFAWLPEDSDPLAAHYGYAGQVHAGPLKGGQTFSFYGSNLQRKYGEDWKNRWHDVTLDRMMSWGFTCFGNWTDPGFFGNGRVPYFAHAWIRGDHKRVSTGNDYWTPMHDPFDPEFTKSVRQSIAGLHAQVKGDPWCIGVFVENELSWGNEYGVNRFGLVIHALERDAATCPAKAAFVKRLKEKYATVHDLNAAWNTDMESWEAFSLSFKHEGGLEDNPRRADFAMLSEALAEEYFSIVNREVKAVMPNHLFCGSRFADWGMTPEAVRAAVKHTDVVSYNLYKEGLQGGLIKLLEEMDRPSVLGEFHFGATDRGMFHGGIGTASSQEDRGIKYRAYMKSVIENPYLVGAHWFQYVDSPTTGRAIDGENYNSGFVSVTDTPYTELIEAARDLNRNLYNMRFGE